MSRPIYGIRFPLIKERTGNRRGPRFRLVPDETGLEGAKACAVRMLRCAIHARDGGRTESDAEFARYRRAQMRSHALWARVFAGHFEAGSEKVVAAQSEARARADAIISRNNPVPT